VILRLFVRQRRGAAQRSGAGPSRARSSRPHSRNFICSLEKQRRGPMRDGLDLPRRLPILDSLRLRGPRSAADSGGGVTASSRKAVNDLPHARHVEKFMIRLPPPTQIGERSFNDRHKDSAYSILSHHVCPSLPGTANRSSPTTVVRCILIIIRLRCHWPPHCARHQQAPTNRHTHVAGMKYDFSCGSGMALKMHLNRVDPVLESSTAPTRDGTMT